jgi:RNA polymerase sigma-70 factor (ECF subfamily)
MIEMPITESAQDLLQKDEQTASIQKAIANLKPEYQEVINLYYWNKKSYEEISEILDCPINTVRTWLHRSKESIRKELYGQIG